MAEFREITAGLRFPEGPVALDDGTVVLTEIERGTITRVDVATGEATVVVELGGGPNGLALGPDGALYVCDNGGYFGWTDTGQHLIPGPNPPAYRGGAIHRVDLTTGESTVLYTECDGRPLVAPNDLVFDGHGGFWFTDHGVQRGEHPDSPGLLYARADGSRIEGRAYGTDGTNGVGLAPDGSRVYAAETHHGTLWAWDVVAPGELAPADPSTRTGGTLLYDAPEGQLFDSLAVDGDGWICVATIGPGGITAVAPDGSAIELVDVPDDFLVTNICFGGATPDGAPDPEHRTAYITASATGRLVATTWPRPGLRLAH